MAMKEYPTFPKSSSNGLMSYFEHLLVGVGGGSYLSAEIQSMYSAAPANWAGLKFEVHPEIANEHMNM